MGAEPLPPTGIPPLSDRDFARFQKLIHEEAGIHLTPAKKELFVARTHKRLRELGLASFKAYFALVAEDPDERTLLFDRISTNETRFFREPQQLGFLSQRVLPRLRQQAEAGLRPRRLRAWSAGCSSGEEPYTLGMILRQQLRAQEGWQVEILATDLSTHALERAERGLYAIERSSEIPEECLQVFMLRGVRSREGWMTVGPELRAMVSFARLNLCTDPYPPDFFDLVLCRNVLIYFDAETRQRVVARLAERLAPEGLLLVGHAESLSGSGQGLRYAGPLTYQRPEEPPP